MKEDGSDPTMVENDVEVKWKKQSINKRQIINQYSLFMRYLMIPLPQKMITFINLFNNTLMTDQTHLRTSSQDSDFIQQWRSPTI